MITRKRYAAMAAAVIAAAVTLQACSDDDDPAKPSVTYTLAIEIDGIGEGVVTSAPAGINCSAGAATGCSATFEEGTHVTLTATPAAGMLFAGWSGAGSGTTTRTVVMDANRTVTASFDNPGLARQVVGTGGGTVAARDSGIVVNIPAGALATNQEITIERIDPSALGDEWDDIRDEVDRAWQFGPDGLTFAQPVTISLAREAVVRAGDTIRAAFRPLATSSNGTVEELDSLTLDVDAANGTSVMSGKTTHFSPFVARDVDAGFYITAPLEVDVGDEFGVYVTADVAWDLTWDVSIEAGPGLEVVSGPHNLLIAAGYSLRCTVVGLRHYSITFIVHREADGPAWRVNFHDIPIDCLVPEQFTLGVSFAGLGDGRIQTVDANGTPDDRIDCVKTGSEVTGVCETMYPAGTTAWLKAAGILTGWSGDASGSDNPTSVLMDRDRTVTGNFDPPPQTGGTFFGIPLTGVEGLSPLVDILFPPLDASPGSNAGLRTTAAPGDCPAVLVAGNGGSVAVNACNGDVRAEYTVVGATAYDAIALPVPSGSTGTHGILMSGNGSYGCDLTTPTTLGMCVARSGQYLDATAIANDPSAGATVVRVQQSPTIEFFRFKTQGGFFDWVTTTASGAQLPSDLRSAIAGVVPATAFTAPDELIAVAGTSGAGGTLYHITAVNSGNPVIGEIGALAGDDPRRIRCDFTSGICAVSDFANSRVTVVLWDGSGAPSIAGSTTAGAIANGPVGIDVFGQRIVTTGYNDGQYSIIEVDQAGTVVSVTTASLPAACTQPGHAIFLRDSANTILASCHGSNGIARVPGAF